MLKGYEFIYVIYHKFAVYVNVTVLDLVAGAFHSFWCIARRFEHFLYESANVCMNLRTAEVKNLDAAF
jgi:hypothetical protein